MTMKILKRTKKNNLNEKENKKKTHEATEKH